jgi:hypothetical protein
MGDVAHVHLGGVDGSQSSVPGSLRLLLNDITGQDRIGERVKDEILKDEDAKKVNSVHWSLFVLYDLFETNPDFLLTDVAGVEHREYAFFALLIFLSPSLK